jgi:hypothetical protein
MSKSDGRTKRHLRPPEPSRRQLRYKVTIVHTCGYSRKRHRDVIISTYPPEEGLAGVFFWDHGIDCREAQIRSIGAL